MGEQQCLYEAKRQADNRRRPIYHQELRRTLGECLPPGAPTCPGGLASPMPYPACAPNYPHTPPNFLSNNSCFSKCTPMPLRFRPRYTPLPPSVSPVIGNADHQFPAHLPRGVNLNNLRQSRGDPGFVTVARDFSRNSCWRRCDYIRDFRGSSAITDPCPYPPRKVRNPLVCLYDDAKQAAG